MRRAFVICAVVVAVMAVPAVAGAHPLGNFTINTYDGVSVGPGAVTVDHVVDMAEIPAFQRRQEIDANGYILEPGSFVLGRTAEFIELFPHSRVAARVEGKSSLARLGIGVHITAPTIHAGFRGTIELEMFNLGVLRVQLVPGILVCQLIFEQTLGTPDKGYQGQFFGQAQA